MIQTENHIFAGLQQDISVSKQQPEYLIDAHNIRITAREGETLLSITNEKGPLELSLKNTLGANASISGTILGHCVLNNYLVLFVHDAGVADSILRIDMSQDDPVIINLFQGEDSGFLGFDSSYPIEAIGDYENENVQKVYWTDGYNQPRVINITHGSNPDNPIPYTWSGSFDFVPTLALTETVTVSRITSASGQFPAGVIQYAFSYYNKYGQETNIFKTTPLYYTSFYDRGASPENIVSNSFKITISGIDTHFDYLRIYSIQRTSLNATPICKRIQDIELDSISGNTATYTDTGTNGSNVDPTSLLYIGGEEVVAQNMCTKDGALFLGNLEIKRPSISDLRGASGNALTVLAKNLTPATSHQAVTLTPVSPTYSSYPQVNGLNTQAAGFKNREYYRLGFQAQYKNGKWSEPIYIKDHQVSDSTYPTQIDSNLTKLIITCSVTSEITAALYAAGYRKIRPVVVFPELQDRTVLCQGVVNPTMYTPNHRSDEDIYAQSSWFFRPQLYNVSGESDYASSPFYSTSACSPYSVGGTILYTQNKDSSGNLTYNPQAIRGVEIQGQYDQGNKFQIDWYMLTMHSPDLTFDDSLQNVDLSGVKCRRVGIANFTSTLSNIDLQTSTPTISTSGAGFMQKAFKKSYANGIISGLFYDDFLVDDYDEDDPKYKAYERQHSSFKWLIYPWQKNGSLNNDITRPANKGTRSADLSKKVISNLRYSDTIWRSYGSTENILSDSTSYVPQVFSSNEEAIVKLGDETYEGNIDTLLAPDDTEGLYCAYGVAATASSKGTTNVRGSNVNTDFTSTSWWKTWSYQADSADHQGVYKRVYENSSWMFRNAEGDIADYTPSLAVNKEPVRMKYKSTAHIVLQCKTSIIGMYTSDYKCVLPIVELYKDFSSTNQFGGTTQSALKANKWIPAGDAVTIQPAGSCVLQYTYGDTWFSRYDCLKTYPFTSEDPNQIVEIGSFMLETRINIDGRYDRNRGQVDNTNMSPTNFNLFNPVYSQKDNFFSYYILDSDYYKLNQFPNQITWSTEKQPGADTDEWTSVTMASTYNLDGSKGQIRSLKVWSNNIYCFQDSGISNILFNSRVQIPTSDGVPIEIANNYKVDGKRYISDGVGSVNKFSICPSPLALYFIDSVGGHLQAINSTGLSDLSLQKNMVTWLGQQDISLWKPNNYTTKVFYDKNNNDIYIVTGSEALCYNETIGQFTSFMSYGNVPVMFNVVDKFYCLKSNYLYEMFAGDYNHFFDEYQGYDFTFVSNGKGGQADLSTVDKIYNNIDFRADKWSDKLDSILSSESPFDYVRVWNEYQDTGEVLLTNLPDKPSILKKKFRVWRMTIPRDANNRRDRMRNTWCKIKLGSAPRYNNGNSSFIQFHDVGLQYFV